MRRLRRSIAVLLLLVGGAGPIGCFQVGGTVDISGYGPPPRSPEEQHNDKLRRDLARERDREKQLRRDIADLENQLK